MESFMTRYLRGEITEEEIKKHGLTRSDLISIKQKYEVLAKMLERYHSSIFDKKEQSERIKEELEINLKIAKLLSLLGKSYQDYLSEMRYTVGGSTGLNLEKGLYEQNIRTLNFIIYLLARRQQNYSLSKLYHHGYSGGCPVTYRVSANVDLLTSKDVPYFRLTSYAYEGKRHLNNLYNEGKSFIFSCRESYGDDDIFGILYQDNEVLSKSDSVGFLGTLGYKTICFLGDDIFRETMAKLLLFSDKYGFDIEDIGTEQQEDYAQAIESMDITGYEVEKDKRKSFCLVKK